MHPICCSWHFKTLLFLLCLPLHLSVHFEVRISKSSLDLKWIFEMLPHSMLRINRKQNLLYIVNDKCLSPYPQEKMNRRVGCSPALASSAEVFIIEGSSCTVKKKRHCFQLLPFMLSEKVPWLFSPWLAGQQFIISIAVYTRFCWIRRHFHWTLAYFCLLCFISLYMNIYKLKPLERSGFPNTQTEVGWC